MALAFPLSYLLVPYAIVAGIFLIFALLNVFHLIHYGATTHTSFVFTAIFIAGTVAIFAATWFVLQDVEWTRQVTLGLADVAPAATETFGL